MQICWGGVKDRDTILETVEKRLWGNGAHPRTRAGRGGWEWGQFPKAVATVGGGGPASPRWQVLVQFGKCWVEGSQPPTGTAGLSHLLC